MATSCSKTSMAGPLGALSVGPAASTTEVRDGIDGRPLGGAVGGSGSVGHRVLKMTSMVGPLGGAADGSGSVHHRGLR
jgi:hypothetical protein